MITPEYLLALSSNKSLSIGDAWNALEMAAETITTLTKERDEARDQLVCANKECEAVKRDKHSLKRQIQQAREALQEIIEIADDVESRGHTLNDLAYARDAAKAAIAPCQGCLREFDRQSK